MKSILMPLIISLFTTNLLYAQEKSAKKIELKSAIAIKSTPIPFLFETGVGGMLKVDQESLSFIPHPCQSIDKQFSGIFPCNNHLIKDINLDFKDISKILRRNYLFIIPNRIFVKTNEGNTFRFVTFKRKQTIDRYKSYKLQNSPISFN